MKNQKKTDLRPLVLRRGTWAEAGDTQFSKFRRFYFYYYNFNFQLRQNQVLEQKIYVNK